jgi:hypothetical protein
MFGVSQLLKAAPLLITVAVTLLNGCGSKREEFKEPVAGPLASPNTPQAAATPGATPAAPQGTISEIYDQAVMARKADQSLAAVNNTPSWFINTKKAIELYRNYVSNEDPTAREQSQSISGGASASGGTPIAKVDGKLEAAKTDKVTSAISQKTPAQQLLASIAALQKRKDTAPLLDVEFEFADKSRVTRLNSTIAALRTDFKIDVSTVPALVEGLARVNNEAAQAVFQRLYDSSGKYAIVIADWTVDPANELHLTYLHPINKLVAQTPPATIDVLLPNGADGIDSDFLSELQRAKGSVIPFTIFGTVSAPKDANNHISKISITPIGVFASGK